MDENEVGSSQDQQNQTRRRRHTNDHYEAVRDKTNCCGMGTNTRLFPTCKYRHKTPSSNVPKAKASKKRTSPSIWKGCQRERAAAQTQHRHHREVAAKVWNQVSGSFWRRNNSRTPEHEVNTTASLLYSGGNHVSLDGGAVHGQAESLHFG